jgi:thioredoxin 2
MDLASLAVPVAVDSVAIFDAAIAGARIPVAVDFWAPWCGPCRAMAPELDKTALAVAGRALILKVSTDQVPELGERFRIQSIPTLVIFRDGRERTRVSGARPAPEIQRLVLEG